MNTTQSPITLAAVKSAFVAASLSLMSNSALAEEPMPQTLTDWFTALQANDKTAISGLLTDDAVIELKDLGFSQTKSEFVDALDQWAELNGEAKIAARTTSVEGNVVETEVCYTFTSNTLFNRETYTLDGAQISASVQEQIGESCEDF